MHEYLLLPLYFILTAANIVQTVFVANNTNATAVQKRARARHCWCCPSTSFYAQTVQLDTLLLRTSANHIRLKKQHKRWTASARGNEDSSSGKISSTRRNVGRFSTPNFSSPSAPSGWTHGQLRPSSGLETGPSAFTSSTSSLKEQNGTQKSPRKR